VTAMCASAFVPNRMKFIIPVTAVAMFFGPKVVDAVRSGANSLISCIPFEVKKKDGDQSKKC